jgi:hypothetical protein
MRQTSVTIPEHEPRWVHELLRAWWREILLFAATAARFACHPRRFGAEWATGRRTAMNPLGFVAASCPILLPLDYGLQALGHASRPDVPLALELARSARPYLFVVPMTLLTALLFRMGGSRRRLTTTLGILLYWTVLSIVGWIVGVVLNVGFHLGDVVPHLAGYLTMIWGGLALGGAHQVRWGWALLAFTPSCVLSIVAVSRSLSWLGWG